MTDWDELLAGTKPRAPQHVGEVNLGRRQLPADVRKMLDDPARPRPTTSGTEYAIAEAIYHQSEAYQRDARNVGGRHYPTDHEWQAARMAELGLVPAREPNGFGPGRAWSRPDDLDEFWSGDYSSATYGGILYALRDELPKPARIEPKAEGSADLIGLIPKDGEWRDIPELTVLLKLSDRATRDQVRAWVHAGELEVTEQATTSGGRAKKLYRRPS